MVKKSEVAKWDLWPRVVGPDKFLELGWALWKKLQKTGCLSNRTPKQYDAPKNPSPDDLYSPAKPKERV